MSEDIATKVWKACGAPSNELNKISSRTTLHNAWPHSRAARPQPPPRRPRPHPSPLQRRRRRLRRPALDQRPGPRPHLPCARCLALTCESHGSAGSGGLSLAEQLAAKKLKKAEPAAEQAAAPAPAAPSGGGGGGNMMDELAARLKRRPAGGEEKSWAALAA